MQTGCRGWGLPLCSWCPHFVEETEGSVHYHCMVAPLIHQRVRQLMSGTSNAQNSIHLGFRDLSRDAVFGTEPIFPKFRGGTLSPFTWCLITISIRCEPSLTISSHHGPWLICDFFPASTTSNHPSINIIIISFIYIYIYLVTNHHEPLTNIIDHH